MQFLIMDYVPFLQLATFIGDAVAGERERHTLETLLSSSIVVNLAQGQWLSSPLCAAKLLLGRASAYDIGATAQAPPNCPGATAAA